MYFSLYIKKFGDLVAAILGCSSHIAEVILHVSFHKAGDRQVRRLILFLKFSYPEPKLNKFGLTKAH